MSKHQKGLVHSFKKSIKWRFTMIFVGLIVLLLVAILLANSFFLERYYVRDKVHTLEEAYETLDEMIIGAENQGEGIDALFPDDYDSGDSDTGTEATRYLKTLTETANVNIVILNTQTDQLFASFGDEGFQARKLNEYILGNRRDTTGKVIETFKNYSIERNVDTTSKNIYLESWGYFSDNATSFIMSMPVAGIKDTVRLFNKFLIIIGAIAVLVGSLFVYMTSREICKPINDLARLSEKMSSLDFSARYEGASQDEIGVLGNSMNKMSENLEQAIGELKTANNELQSDIENKTKLAVRQQEFVANVSHELKTPIALIQGYAEGLQEGLAEDPATRDEYCGVIVDEAKRMNTMVRSLMTLSAIEQGKDLPDFALFDLSEVVQGIVTKSDILIRQQNAKVEVDVPEGTMVWADEFKIEEVITNYLNNALHHLKEPNAISIYTETLPERVTLHVQNSGNPIPEEDLDRIWDKFFKVDKAHTRSYGGSGLGLSIVKAIADAHHQQCGVRNTRTGVDFWFTLDRKQS